MDAKAFAQSAAEKALANSKELLELKASELKAGGGVGGGCGVGGWGVAFCGGWGLRGIAHAATGGAGGGIAHAAT